MFGNRQTDLNLAEPKTIPEIVGTAASVYLRYAPLLLVLGGVVVIPYDAIYILVAHNVQINENANGIAHKIVLLTALEFLIVQPLLASLQAHAVAMIGSGEEIRLREIFRRSLKVLLNVIAAEIVAGIAIFVGFVLFIIPGVILLMRFAVVAQSVAIENLDWPSGLRRSWDLSRGNWWRILGVLLIGALINVTVDEVAGALVSPGLGVGQVIAAVIATLLTLSFTALLTAILYFDLRARRSY